MSPRFTYATCLTPAGSGAIAGVGLIGPNAWEVAAPLYQPGGTRRPALSPRKQFYIGRFGENVSDDVVVSVEQGGSGQRVEIHSHGGPAVVRWLLALLTARGATVIGCEEWLHRTHQSRLMADAAVALTMAPTQRTAGILLDQYHGALAAALGDLGEEIARDGEGAIAKRQALRDRIPLGRHLTHPWRVVLAGAPNVGKSTLLNTILGYQRAITSPVPGTTRDVVTALTAFDGWPIELADTAGVRETAVGLEAAGLELAKQVSANADLCLWVLDATADPVLPIEPTSAPMLPVINKIDQPAVWPISVLPWPATDAVSVSAKTGDGVPELIATIAARLVPDPPPPGAAVPFTDHQWNILAQVDEALRSGLRVRAAELLRACDTPLYPVD